MHWVKSDQRTSSHTPIGMPITVSWSATTTSADDGQA